MNGVPVPSESWWNNSISINDMTMDESIASLMLVNDSSHFGTSESKIELNDDDSTCNEIQLNITNSDNGTSCSDGSQTSLVSIIVCATCGHFVLF